MQKESRRVLDNRPRTLIRRESFSSKWQQERSWVQSLTTVETEEFSKSEREVVTIKVAGTVANLQLKKNLNETSILQSSYFLKKMQNNNERANRNV